ncbi:RNA polymerase sigma factor [Chitinophaga ginsengisoli]|uniref:RNA polymerase sigma-70 factor (ECF subfamily) n=1 Tax=Chitinophaga ginsengisoli TaxID=363837 RepID=A0A2P8G9Q6_9BACT|nr:sigma-70 family RNA polymerase sigma factor [Chitinophaga ginsengisoli]PSL30701.1 RNA polymerase sigma-70 factor (ECF subfamily) [Chitinophaga ginsengisoli]
MKGEETKHSDFELLEQIKADSASALAELHAKYRTRMLREAFYIVNDLNDAEDIVQEIFIDVWNRRNKIGTGPFLPYLLRATWNASVLHMKNKLDKEEKQKMYDYVSEKITTEQPFEQEELARLLDKALQLVPPAARRSFMLQYMEGHNQKGIAAQQNISLQVVKNNVSLALKILRSVLGSKKSL